MILVWLIIFIVMFIIGFVLKCSHTYKIRDIGDGVLMGGTFGTVIFGIIFFSMLGYYLYSQHTIDNKIELCVEENTQLEAKLVDATNMWLQHQSDIFESISDMQGVTTYLVKYPELQGQEIIIELMDKYDENSTELKQLKNEKINLKGISRLGWFGK